MIGIAMKIDPKSLEWKEAHELLTGVVVPRPIAFVSTVGEDGIYNVAPYSFFAPIAVKPMLVGFNVGWKANGQKKDTLVNIESCREFVVNAVNENLAEAMNRASKEYPSSVDEFKAVGLTPVRAGLVKPPMVGESPVNMECRLMQILEFGISPRRTSFIIGQVVRVHIRDDLYINGEIEMSKLKAIARMGGELYCRTTDMFEMIRPKPSSSDH
jgi:flavin reductase (DIM6/NTAB) family NADH-FMN oxidoreductase RutF